MRRITLVTLGAAVAVTPALIGVLGNASFAERLPVRAPVSASVRDVRSSARYRQASAKATAPASAPVAYATGSAAPSWSASPTSSRPKWLKTAAKSHW